MSNAAYLLLANGSTYSGIAVGARGYAVGEVVFHTSMTGYQEILTDPSYAQQIVTLTYPHIGNTGINTEDSESKTVQAAGLVIRDCPNHASSWRKSSALHEYLVQHGIVAVSQVDTRRLTRELRTQGATNAIIYTHNIQAQEAKEHLQQFGGIIGADLAGGIGIQQPAVWTQKQSPLSRPFHRVANTDAPLTIAAYDFGVKDESLRIFAQMGFHVRVVPAHTSAQDVLAMKPHGIFLSNGPGDPKPCTYAIAAVRTFIQKRIPLFGVCLGHQLLALACGAQTVKMKFGHHGANHPVLDIATRRVLISSQNHGFCVDEASLPSCLQASHRSLFDGSLQGIRHKEAPAFAFQGHP